MTCYLEAHLHWSLESSLIFGQATAERNAAVNVALKQGHLHLQQANGQRDNCDTLQWLACLCAALFGRDHIAIRAVLILNDSHVTGTKLTPS